MSVELLRPWLSYGLGAVIDLGAEVNEKLVKSGKARYVDNSHDGDKAEKPKGKK